MYKYILKFTKENNIRFISHLDLMGVYERAFRRAAMKLSYSKGFHPHPKISIAHPISLGYSSTGEYMEIELEDRIEANELVRRLNESLPDGLVILSGEEVLEKMKALVSLVRYAEYSIKVHLDEKSKDIDFETELEKFLNLDEVLIQKRVRKGRIKVVKEVDVKQNIKSVKIVNKTEDLLEIDTILRTGSEGNLNPELMMRAFFKNSDIEISFDNIFFHRNELFFDEELSGVIK